MTAVAVAAASGAASDLDGISRWVVDVMEAVGAPRAGVDVALENLFPPIPSEVILPLAGFTASRGGVTLLEAIFWTTAGSLLGAYVLYVLGGWLGRDRTVRSSAGFPSSPSTTLTFRPALTACRCCPSSR